MNKAVIFHWWQEWSPGNKSSFADTPKPYQNLRVPVVLSIATLRAHNNYIPIYLMDCSDHPAEWDDFPEKLDFKVVPWKPYLQDYKNRNGWKNLSRMGDIYEFSKRIPEQEIIYTDSDIFWLKDVLPLWQQSDKFCFNHYNSGFYYYDKTSKHVKDFIELFKAYVTVALNDKNIRKQINSTVSWDFWYYVLDEVVMQYMWQKNPECVNKIGYAEHGLPRDIRWPNVNVKDIKMFHSNGMAVDNKFHKVNAEQKDSRGLVCLVFKELYDAIAKVLSQEDIESIFTREEINYYVPLQLSMMNGELVQRLQAIDVDYNDDIPFKEIINPNSCKQELQ